MRQGKYTIRLIAAIFAICGLFVSNHAEAVLPTSCNAGSGVSVAIDNTGGNFPLVINDNNADTSNYCGNTIPANYPCSVFRYTISGDSTTGYTHAFFTVPYCIESNLTFNKGDLYSACPYPTENSRWAPTGACGSQVLRISPVSGSAPIRDMAIAVKGNDIGLGVNSLTFAHPNKDTLYCVSTDSSGNTAGGILGPACPQRKCDTAIVRAKNLCTTIEGYNIKIDMEEGKPAEISSCTNTDCTGVCDPLGAGDSYPSDSVCIVFDDDPLKCWTLAELGTATGNTNKGTGYVTFHDSPGYTWILVGGKWTRVYVP